MKKLFLILLFTSISFAQTDLLLLMSGSDYKNVETTQYLASLTTPISKTYAATLDSFITKVKDSLSITLLSAKFDVMYDLGGETQEQSLKNLVKRSHDATAVNSPKWTQWQGVGGDTNTVKYVNTNYNPSTQGFTYLQNSASRGVYRRVKGLTNLRVLSGCSEPLVSGSTFLYSGSKLYYNINTLTDRYYDNASNDAAYFILHNRSSATAIQLYRNGTSIDATTSNNSTVPPNGNFFLLADNLVGTGARWFGTDQLSFFFVGASLTAPEASKLTNCIEWLMDRKGTGVIP